MGPAQPTPYPADLPEGYPEEPVPELYFATVRAIGTPIANAVVTPLEQTLRRVNFDLAEIKLSERLHEVPQLAAMLPAPDAPAVDRYSSLTDCGEWLRADREDAAAVAMEAVRYLHTTARPTARREALSPPEHLGVAYLFRNLMHADEVRRLRKLYDRKLFVISIFSPEDRRAKHLAEVLAGTARRPADLQASARRLIERETGGPTTPSASPRARNTRYALNIESAFHHGDLFVDASDAQLARDEVQRFVELIFRYPFHTPRVEEIGMADAFSAALESGNLARPVGAAITTADGELLVTGTNDVPRSGGGVYRAGDKPDHRDHNREHWGYDSSDRHRREILANFMRHLLADPAWLEHIRVDGSKSAQKLAAALAEEASRPTAVSDDKSTGAQKPPAADVDYEKLVATVIASPIISQSEFFDVIEYGRTLHAEMDAITSAARKGISLRGATLYCTTLPCHECARLIIGAGIQRVVFIEPYEKSRALDLYKTEIAFKTFRESMSEPHPTEVHFIPYVGISPRRFQELFAWVPRKKSDLDGHRRDLSGDVVDWDARQDELAGLAPDVRAGRTEEIIRESIASPSAFLSKPRFRDRYEHEAYTLNAYEKTKS